MRLMCSTWTNSEWPQIPMDEKWELASSLFLPASFATMLVRFFMETSQPQEFQYL